MGIKKQIYTYDFSGGLVIDKLPHKLKANQSPKMLNMLPFDKNGIMMRSGQKYKTASPVNGRISCVYPLLFDGHTVFAGNDGHDSFVYYCDLSEEVPVYPFIYKLTGDDSGIFFEFEGALYFLNGTEYIKITPIETSGLAAQEVVGYIPLVYVNGYANGTNLAVSQPFNLLSAKYRVQYIPDGTAKTFSLPHMVSPEQQTKIRAYSLSPVHTELTNFTVSTTNDVTAVTFTSAPLANAYFMGGNTLEIEAPYEETDFPAECAKIKNCRLTAEYGGSLSGTDSGTRVFFTGNPNYPGSIWWSAVTSGDYSAAEYFPDINVEVIGDAKKANTALSKQYQELIVFKEHSIFALSYTFDGTAVHFQVRELHGRLGCDMPGSVQLINNNLCFANSYGGVFLIISTNNNDERNVVPISGNINRSEKISEQISGILNFQTDRLKTAISFDDGQRYWLCIRPYIYLWDYSIAAYSNLSDTDAAQNRLSWWLLDQFDALCWLKINGVVHYGSASKLDFIIPSEKYNDFGEKITAYYKTKGYDGGDPTVWKNFKQLIFSQKTVRIGQAVFRYTADSLQIAGETVHTGTFSIPDFTFDTFTFAIVNYGAIHTVYPQLEHTAYFSWQVENGEKDTDLFITDIKTIFYFQHQDY